MEPANFVQQAKEVALKAIREPFTPSKIFSVVVQVAKLGKQVVEASYEERIDLTLEAVKEAIRESDKISEEKKAKVLMLIDTYGATVLGHAAEFADDLTTFFMNKVLPILTCQKCRERKKERRSKKSFKRGAKLGSTDNKVAKVTNYLKLKIQPGFSHPDLVGLLSSGIRFVENYDTLTGSEKKDLVIRSVKAALDDAASEAADKLLPEEAQELKKEVNNLSSDLINLFVFQGKQTESFHLPEASV